MGELDLAAKREQAALEGCARQMTIQQRMAEEKKFAEAEFQLKKTAMSQDIDSLDKTGKDYENKLKQLQDKQKQLVQAHENEITAIKDKAEMERNQKTLSAEQHFKDEITSGLTQVLMGHQSFAAMMGSIGNQVASGMMQNAIKNVMANDFTKESDAAKAARDMFNAGAKFPFPANIVMAPALGAMAFASVMAFADGTDGVPGSGKGDKSPRCWSRAKVLSPEASWTDYGIWHARERWAAATTTMSTPRSTSIYRRSIVPAWMRCWTSTGTNCKNTLRKRCER